MKKIKEIHTSNFKTKKLQQQLILMNKKLMIWYNSLFLGRGKPSTHIAALKDIGDTEIIKMPHLNS